MRNPRHTPDARDRAAFVEDGVKDGLVNSDALHDEIVEDRAVMAELVSGRTTAAAVALKMVQAYRAEIRESLEPHLEDFEPGDRAMLTDRYLGGYATGLARRLTETLKDLELEDNPRKFASKLVVKRQRGQLEAVGPVNTPRDAARAVDALIGDRAYEYLVALYLDARNHVFAYDEFTSGAQTKVYVEPAAIGRDALLVGALGVITAHQHPSGDVTPSHEDSRLWSRLTSILELLGLKALDHLVTAREADGTLAYYSLAEASRGRVYA